MASQTSPAVEATHPQIERHIMRREEVERKTGFKRAHIYSLMKEGKFPQARRIGLRAVGWDSLEIEQWINQRLAQQA
ncbi:AlpA family transcriptional regulator [Pseudomonas sp. Q1]|uniref:AlpA family transcriptional regulator n=1 Tax=Pseudomonas sp. Q1 TaxID=2202823 RepID=UPI001374E50B|nr:AlpA family transcriptional regulator [Pseudomonas sp. Q1]NCE85786.1 transcriptional regulator [Pseudomonas sp. Q1]